MGSLIPRCKCVGMRLHIIWIEVFILCSLIHINLIHAWGNGECITYYGSQAVMWTWLEHVSQQQSVPETVRILKVWANTRGHRYIFLLQTVGHLLLSSVFTGYIVFAVAFYEEPDLVKTLGPEYTKYMKKTPRFFPNLPSFGRKAARDWSLALYTLHTFLIVLNKKNIVDTL